MANIPTSSSEREFALANSPQKVSERRDGRRHCLQAMLLCVCVWEWLRLWLCLFSCRVAPVVMTRDIHCMRVCVYIYIHISKYGHMYVCAAIFACVLSLKTIWLTYIEKAVRKAKPNFWLKKWREIYFQFRHIHTLLCVCVCYTRAHIVGSRLRLAFAFSLALGLRGSK